MAKVEIEDRAFQEPSLRLAVSRHRVTAGAIIGQAAILWRHSQQAGMTKASRENIVAWLDTDRYAKPDLFIDWLVSAGFLEGGPDTFHIHGNAPRVMRTQERIKQAKRGASTRWQKQSLCSEHALSNADSNALSNQPAMPDRETVRQEDIKTDNNYMSEPKVPTHSPRDFAELWNSLKAEKMAAINLNTFTPKSKRWLWAEKRLKEQPDFDYWRGIIIRIAKSDFCRGSNDRGWMADFEFLIRPETHIKTLEGKYDNRDSVAIADKGYWDEVKRLCIESDLKNEER